MTTTSVDSRLPIPGFGPDIELADFFVFERQSAGNPDATGTIHAELNPEDLSYVFLAIDPPGDAVLARSTPGWDVSHDTGFDLRPAEARELGRRLLALAEAAQSFVDEYGDGTSEQA